MSKEIWFESAGTKLYGVEGGSGRPVILLHGGLANHQACRLFAEPLSDRVRLITPDLRASGRSVFADALDWSLLADDVTALVRHLELGRVVVGGISFGAAVAVRFALDHADLVDGLVLLHPAYAGADVGLTATQTAAVEQMQLAGERTLRDGIEALFPLFDTLPESIRDRARRVVATYDPASVATSTRFMREATQPFAKAGELARISAPTLVVPGIDPTHPREMAERLAAHIPRCTLVESADLATAIGAFVATLDHV